jgi:hypothetical protein
MLSSPPSLTALLALQSTHLILHNMYFGIALIRIRYKKTYLILLTHFMYDRLHLGLQLRYKDLVDVECE